MAKRKKRKKPKQQKRKPLGEGRDIDKRSYNPPLLTAKPNDIYIDALDELAALHSWEILNSPGMYFVRLVNRRGRYIVLELLDFIDIMKTFKQNPKLDPIIDAMVDCLYDENDATPEEGECNRPAQDTIERGD